MKFAGLIAIAMCLTAGMCGSVLRGHTPDGWTAGSMGNWVKNFGRVEIESGALIRREGSSLHLVLTNKRTALVTVRSVELVDRDTRESFPGEWALAPGDRQVIDAGFKGVVTSARCSIRLMLNDQAVVIEYVE